jgi:mannose-6-phosphate isomerase
VTLEPAFSVVVVVHGAGELSTPTEPALKVKVGETVLVPHGAGPCTVHGDLELIRCKPSPTGGL